MASIDSLPADQRAVLELVLRRGRSYDEIAELLSIDRADVRARALAALDAIGPETQVPRESRALITDYLLGALAPEVAEVVRDHLAGSASERAWARVVSSELQGIASEPMPGIPAAGGEAPAAREPAPEPAPEPAAIAPPPEPEPEPAPEPEPVAAEPVPEAAQPVAAPAAAAAVPAMAAAEPVAAAAPTPPPDGDQGRPSSRAGGALLLLIGGLLAVVVAVVVVVLLSSGGSSAKHPASAAKPPSTTATSTTSTSGARVISQINLKPPSGGSSPIGIADVLTEQGKVGIAIVAQGLKANSKKPPNAYAVWLYNSPTDSHILGFVNPGVTSNGRLQTAGALPSNASHYQKLLITLETQSNPKTPGTIVLEGTLTGV